MCTAGWSGFNWWIFFQESNVQALDILFTYHGAELLQHRLAILSNFPETTSPHEYTILLPEAWWVQFHCPFLSLKPPYSVIRLFVGHMSLHGGQAALGLRGESITALPQRGSPPNPQLERIRPLFGCGRSGWLEPSVQTSPASGPASAQRGNVLLNQLWEEDLNRPGRGWTVAFYGAANSTAEVLTWLKWRLPDCLAALTS